MCVVSITGVLRAVYVWGHTHMVEMKKGMAENNIYHVITSNSGTLPPMMNLGFQPCHRVKETYQVLILLEKY